MLQISTKTFATHMATHSTNFIEDDEPAQAEDDVQAEFEQLDDDIEDEVEKIVDNDDDEDEVAEKIAEDPNADDDDYGYITPGEVFVLFNVILIVCHVRNSNNSICRLLCS
jgi:3-methyladenine DNA glycosylase/8-oxoguanine DNA glycosylase